MAPEKAQGAYQGNEHNGCFHLNFSGFNAPFFKRDGLMRG
jgi:hypothetical protein